MLTGILFNTIQIGIYPIVEHGHESTRSRRVPFVDYGGRICTNATNTCPTTTQESHVGLWIVHVLGFSIVFDGKGLFQIGRGILFLSPLTDHPVLTRILLVGSETHRHILVQFRLIDRIHHQASQPGHVDGVQDCDGSIGQWHAQRPICLFRFRHGNPIDGQDNVTLVQKIRLGTKGSSCHDFGYGYQGPSSRRAKGNAGTVLEKRCRHYLDAQTRRLIANEELKGRGLAGNQVDRSGSGGHFSIPIDAHQILSTGGSNGRALQRTRGR